ncbi:uncharacterized protein THITE_156816 [Thermothielavioides terrestris NRRL 8126]|uniref:Uncharacterized protein n=1 Tax=Thermothielavioides terrestris (strain ATCC 38088 / NRRL 8126) TaxID=578455 RepID=G2RCI9_THETT|nr:uncharacterized protein THITE_156816 [Thermothielavioides terrestris NRRL 8126]AEO70624.1 hypothetical protein THITE_156816 [Thermothielavioides terrestris NRRL 8126]
MASHEVADPPVAAAAIAFPNSGQKGSDSTMPASHQLFPSSRLPLANDLQSVPRNPAVLPPLHVNESQRLPSIQKGPSQQPSRIPLLHPTPINHYHGCSPRFHRRSITPKRRLQHMNALARLESGKHILNPPSENNSTYGDDSMRRDHFLSIGIGRASSGETRIS